MSAMIHPSDPYRCVVYDDRRGGIDRYDDGRPRTHVAGSDTLMREYRAGVLAGVVPALALARAQAIATGGVSSARYPNAPMHRVTILRKRG